VQFTSQSDRIVRHPLRPSTLTPAAEIISWPFCVGSIDPACTTRRLLHGDRSLATTRWCVKKGTRCPRRRGAAACELSCGQGIHRCTTEQLRVGCRSPLPSRAVLGADVANTSCLLSPIHVLYFSTTIVRHTEAGIHAAKILICIAVGAQTSRHSVSQSVSQSVTGGGGTVVVVVVVIVVVVVLLPLPPSEILSARPAAQAYSTISTQQCRRTPPLAPGNADVLHH
jgi:hypothetical protein